MYEWKNGELVELKEGALEQAIHTDFHPEDDCGDFECHLINRKWMKVQSFGNPDGYGYDLWRREQHDDRDMFDELWAVLISDGSDWQEIVVQGYKNLMGIMNHLAIGAIAAVLDGEELNDMFAERAQYREARKQAGEAIRGALKKAFEPCNEPDCPRCTARKKEEEDRQSRAN